VRPQPLAAGDGSLLERSFAACIATILEIDVADVPPRDESLPPVWGWRRWLNGRGLGLVPIADAATFAWPGPWIGVVGEEPRAVVMFGVPSGIAWDPAGGEADAPSEGFALAALDIALAQPPALPAPTQTGVVVAIAVAASAGGVVELLDACEALPGRGLAGDRHSVGVGTFPSFVPGSALTLVEAEVIESFEPPLSPAEHRRNVVTRGIDLNALVGRDFLLGDVRCRGSRLCEPCSHLDRYSTRDSLLRPLVHRGGLRADILSGGTVRVGDVVRAA
jgi:hypothetical protein